MRRVAIILLALALAVTMAAGQADVAAPTQALVQPRPRTAAAPLPAAAPAAGASPALAPLAAALAGNASFSTFWTVIQAARLEKLFDDPAAQLTILAPTNAAWAVRLPSLTTGVNLTLPQLLSDGRARVLEQVVNYHALPGRPVETLNALGLRGRLPTNANSCSTAKNVEVAAVQPSGEAAGQVTLASSLGGTARTVGGPIKVRGGSVIFPIDDVLLPATVTLPTEAALAGPGALETSAVDPAALEALAASIKGKEPLPLTDEAGLAARDRAAEGANSVPVGVGGGGGGGGGEEEGGAAPATPRRQVAVPTLPAKEEGSAVPSSPPAFASMDGGPVPIPVAAP